MASNERECWKQAQWSLLPSLPLEKIYSYVSREDQTNMSLVCRKWSKGFDSPSVWKTFKFDLTESQLLASTCSVMKFARKYSNMFRHVIVCYHRPEKKILINNWCKYFIEFMDILTKNSQLNSVKFVELLWFRKSLNYYKICRVLADFLRSQRHFQCVVFAQCCFELREGVELLKIVTENSRDFLNHLTLEEVLPNQPNHMVEDAALKIASMLLGLPSLQTLRIDYSLIFENMVLCQSYANTTLSNCQTPVLSKIILKYNDNFPEIEKFRGLKSTDWLFLKTRYPELQVELDFETCFPKQRSVKFLIVPGMPITRLNYNYCDFVLNPQPLTFMEFDELFEHLIVCKTNELLESFCIRWPEPNPDIASCFFIFLQSCKKLKFLKLFVVHPNYGIELLMKSWQETRPDSLNKVLIEISYKYDDDYINMMNLTNECVAGLVLLGLDIKVDYILYE